MNDNLTTDILLSTMRRCDAIVKEANLDTLRKVLKQKGIVVNEETDLVIVPTKLTDEFPLPPWCRWVKASKYVDQIYYMPNVWALEDSARAATLTSVVKT